MEEGGGTVCKRCKREDYDFLVWNGIYSYVLEFWELYCIRVSRSLMCHHTKQSLRFRVKLPIVH